MTYELLPPAGAYLGALKDEFNSTLTPLAAGETWPGAWASSPHPDLFVNAKSDKAGTLYVEFSMDAETIDFTGTYVQAANKPAAHRFVKAARFHRVRWENTSGEDQGTLRISVTAGKIDPLTSSLQSTLAQAADSIVARTVGEELIIAQGLFDGYRVVTKFGRNTDVDAAEDIWNGGGDYTGFPTGAAEGFQVVSSNAADAAGGTGARTLRVFYLNDDYEGFDANGDALYFDVTMDGTTPAPAGVSGVRAYRAYVLTSGSSGSNVGTITVQHITTTANVFLAIPVAQGQTKTTSYTVPAGWTGYLIRYGASMVDNGTSRAIMAFRTREFGSATWRVQRDFGLTNNSQISREIYGGVRLPEKTDIVMRALSVTSANADITGTWDMILVRN